VGIDLTGSDRYNLHQACENQYITPTGIVLEKEITSYDSISHPGHFDLDSSEWC